MPNLRDHAPLVIEEFNGWWDRGEDETCPSDHFSQADNIQYYESGFETRFGIKPHQSTAVNEGTQLRKILRVYNYITQTDHTLLVLVSTGTPGNIIGTIYHVTDLHAGNNVAILTIPGMTDFGFVATAGRAYITPFTTYFNNVNQPYNLGLPNEFLYVYKGDGTPARKAGGVPPTNSSAKPLIGYNNDTGTVTSGIHVINVSFNPSFGGPSDPTQTHFLYSVVNAPGGQKIQLNNIPIGPVGTTSRTIGMTLAISVNTFNTTIINSLTYYIAWVLTDNTTESFGIDIDDITLAAKGNPAYSGIIPHSSALAVINSSVAGFKDEGFHLIAVVYETDTGFLTAPGPEFFAGNTYVDSTKKVTVVNIPVPTDLSITKKHIVSTKEIPQYNGDQNGYQFFFIPGAVLDPAVTTIDLSYFDSDLVADASYLLDNFETISAGVALTTYHSRLVLVGDSSTPDTVRRSRNARVAAPRIDNRSVARVSQPGEPEAISKVDGLIVVPLDGNPLTNCMEFRDALHLFKESRTYAYVDNGDVPASWQEKVIDMGVGTTAHGIATVLDTGGVNIDFLIVADYSGLMLFNGVYSRPELTWKIEDFWVAFQAIRRGNLQIVNDSVNKRMYISLPPPFDNFVLQGDYRNGLDSKGIRWSRWIYDANISSVCLYNVSSLVFGAR